MPDFDLIVVGAGLAGGLLIAVSGVVRAPEALILFGVALSSFAGAATALIFNLSPSPIAQAEVMAWLLGSVQNRSWIDVAWVAPALAVAAPALADPRAQVLAYVYQLKKFRRGRGRRPTPIAKDLPIPPEFRK